MKKLSKVGKLSSGLTLLCLASALFPIPIPVALINYQLGLKSEELEMLNGEALLYWPKGLISVSNSEIRLEEAATIKYKKISLDLKRSILRATDGSILIKKELKELFNDFKTSNQSDQSFIVHLEETSLQHLEFEAVGTATINIDKNDIDMKAQMNFVKTLEGDIEIFAKSNDSLRNWTAQSRSNLSASNNKTNFLPDLPITFKKISSSNYLKVKGQKKEITEWTLTAQSQLSNLAHKDSGVTATTVLANFYGNEKHGLSFESQSVIEDNTLLSRGEIKWNEDESFEICSKHSASSITINDELKKILDKALPTTGQWIQALGAKGEIALKASNKWSSQHNEYTIHIQPKNLSLKYNGYGDATSDHFSFPYSTQFKSGESAVTITENQIFIDLEGLMGEAALKSYGHINLKPNNNTYDINFQFEELTLDSRISYALSGNPNLSKAWRDLGSPKNGRLTGAITIAKKDAEDFYYKLDLNAKDTLVSPTALPITAKVINANILATPKHIEINSKISALGSHLELKAISTANMEKLHCDIKGVDLKLTPSDALLIKNYLPTRNPVNIPAVEANLNYKATILSDKNWEESHVYAEVSLDKFRLPWEGGSAEFKNQHAKPAHFFSENNRYYFHIPLIESNNGKETIQLFAQGNSEENKKNTSIIFNNININKNNIGSFKKNNNEVSWGTDLDWSGTINGFTNVNLNDTKDFEAYANLESLKVVSLNNNATIRLSGPVKISPGKVNSPKLKILAAQSEFSINNFNGILDSEGLRCTANISSNSGLNMRAGINFLASKELAKTLKALGADGVLFAEDIEVESYFPDEGPFQAKFKGKMRINEFEMHNSFKLEDGAAGINVTNAWWNSEKDFGGHLKILNGTGTLNNLKVRNVITDIALTPKEAICSQMHAELLDGVIETDGFDENNTFFQGNVRIGLKDSLPIGVSCFLHNLDLGSLRNELEIPGALSGKLSGRLEVESPTPSPTFAKGSAQLKVNRGILGAVPVLNKIWQVAGLTPPIINTGNFKIRLNGNGIINMEHFSLDGAAIELTGKGYALMDSSVNLKVTMRTFSILGRLPLLKDIWDFFIEQQVYGPIESPIIVQRSMSKIAGAEFQRPPFPLWVPMAETPNWNISPIIPISEKVIQQ